MPAKKQALTVRPGESIRLADFDPAFRDSIDRDEADKQSRANVEAISPLAERLYAENRRALLVILQGMDASGKDGTIRAVMHGVNPQSCQVVPFKTPTENELERDFLWRIHNQIPSRGNIGLFNRSHYEDVLIVRVKKLVPEPEWRTRFDHINSFEKLLTDSYITIVKIFLHISKDEQRRRLQKRVDNPDKRWKFRLGDLEDRRLWDEYQHAYEEAMTRCNTAYAPWYIVPADKKWYRNLVVSRLVREALEKMGPQFPPALGNVEGLVVE